MTVQIHRTSIEEAGTITTAKGEEPVWKVLFEMSYPGANEFSLHFNFKIVGPAGSAQGEEAAYQELRTFLDEASTEVASRAGTQLVSKSWVSGIKVDAAQRSPCLWQRAKTASFRVESADDASAPRSELYASPNGDRWLLGRRPGGELVVCHYPNRASGGAFSETEVDMFLRQEPQGPEHQALVTVLATLISLGRAPGSRSDWRT